MRRPALLAALAGLLGACRGIKPSAVTERASDQADQMLVHMTHMLTANGVARAKVQSDTAFLFSNTQTADLRTVRVTFYDALGHETSTLTARTGSYQWRTGDMEGRGKVVVVTKDGRRLETEALRYNQVKDSVSSDVPFTFDAPDRHIVGEGFTSDPSFRNVIAKRPRGTGGGFVLPNQ